MGFASYKEDIERARDDLLSLKESLGVGDTSPVDAPLRLRKLQDLCDRVLVRFSELLDLATDPELTIADEIIAVRKTCNELQSLLGTRTAEYKREIEALKIEAASETRRLKGINAQLGQEFETLRDRNSELSRTLEFERKGRSDFGAMIERFPPKA